MSGQQQTIEMLVSMLMAGETYAAHRVYSVPASLAAQLVREKSARIVRAAGSRGKPEGTWQATVRAGDTFTWQIKVELPHLIKPRISARYETARIPAGARKRKRYLEEVGGDGPRVSPAQAKAVDFLLRNEAKVYPKLLRALAAYANRCRADWDLNDRVAPKDMTESQVAQRIEFRTVYISSRSRHGMAYLEFHGECAWDRDHGFAAVLHGQRLVDILQQGTGWVDRRPPKRRGGQAAEVNKKTRMS